MSYIVVDVESDGPIPYKYSMVCFGAVVLEPSLSETFYGKVKPISETYIADALAVSGFSRQDHESFDDPKEVMELFAQWLSQNSKGRPIFISDNPRLTGNGSIGISILILAKILLVFLPGVLAICIAE